MHRISRNYTKIQKKIITPIALLTPYMTSSASNRKDQEAYVKNNKQDFNSF